MLIGKLICFQQAQIVIMMYQNLSRGESKHSVLASLDPPKPPVLKTISIGAQEAQ